MNENSKAGNCKHKYKYFLNTSYNQTKLYIFFFTFS